MKKTVIYVRKSREDKNSIENQIKLLSSFVSKMNLNIFKVYCDECYSGADFERPSFLLMVDDIKKGLIDIIVVKDLSRIGRSLYKVGNFIENLLYKNDVRLISVIDKIDTINKISYDELIFKNLFNELYLKDYKLKINNSLDNLGSKRKIYRCIKYGYKKVNEKICVDEYASKIIKRIFEYAYIGYSNKQISEILNKENIMPRAKYMKEVLGVKSNHSYHICGKWDSKMIRNILIDKEYCGYVINFNYSKKSNVEIKNEFNQIVEEEKYIKIKENNVIRKSYKDKKEDNIINLIVNKNIRYLYAKRKVHKYYCKEKNFNVSIKRFHEMIFISIINLLNDKYIDKFINDSIIKINKFIKKYNLIKGKYLEMYEKFISRKISYNEFNRFKDQYNLILNKFNKIKKFIDFEKKSFKKLFNDYIISDRINKLSVIRNFTKKIIINNVDNDINLYVFLEKTVYIENIIGY